MKRSCIWLLGVSAALLLPAAAAAATVAVAAAVAKVESQGQIPKDLLDDAHVREELAVNEFTAPSISSPNTATRLTGFGLIVGVAVRVPPTSQLACEFQPSAMA